MILKLKKITLLQWIIVISPIRKKLRLLDHLEPNENLDTLIDVFWLKLLVVYYLTSNVCYGATFYHRSLELFER